MRIAALVLVAACSASDDLPAPQIASVNPQHAAPGGAIVIAGSFFCHQSEEGDSEPCTTMGTVYFGTTVATALQYDENSITAEVPDGTGTADITVIVAGEHSNAVTFTFD